MKELPTRQSPEDAANPPLATPAKDALAHTEQLAIKLFDVAGAAVSLPDEPCRICGSTHVGPDPTGDYKPPPCAQAVTHDDVWVCDAPDGAFANGDLRNSPTFVAGAPLFATGNRLGTLLIWDSRPRKLSEIQREMLRVLAAQAADIVELHTDTVSLRDEIGRREAGEAAAQEWHGKLEALVEARANDISAANEALLAEVARHQRTETALRRAKEKYRNIFESAHEGIYQTTPEGRYVSANPALARILGYDSPTELMRACYDVSRQLYVDPGRRTEFIRRLNGTDTLCDFESEVFRKDGSTIWISETAIAVRGSNRELIYYQGSCIDITERKLQRETAQQSLDDLERCVQERTAELAHVIKVLREQIQERERTASALRDSEERFRQIAENVRDVFWITSRDTTEIVYISPAFDRIWGRDRSAFMGGSQRWLDTVHPDDRDKALRVIHEIKASGEYESEFRIVRPDGQVRWIRDRGFPVYNERGEIYRVAGIAQDTTDRKLTEQALRESEARKSAIVETALDCIITIDANGKVVEWNPAAEETFGYTREGALGRDLTDLIIPPSFRSTHQEGIAQYLSSGGRSMLGQRLETIATNAHGDEIPVEVAITSIASPDKPLFTAYLRDISDRKRSELALRRAKEEAEQANRAKSEFLSRMSHELRTPLNAILGFTQLLCMDERAPRDRQNLDHISRAGRHLLELINEILDITSIESGRVSFSIEPVSTEEVMREIVDLMRPIGAERSVELHLELQERIFVLADRQRVKQILLNLLSNAIKYNREGGTVTLRSIADDERVRLEVSDTGNGIDSSKLSRLFTPFDRLGAEQGPIPGTGIGLALTKRLVQAMNGLIEVHSEVGEGTTFTVALPRTQGVRHTGGNEDDDTTDTPPDDGRNHTILYIEDNLANFQLIEMVFNQRPNLRLLAAMQGGLGLDLAREHRPSLVLLDLHLPDISGEEVLRQLHEGSATRDIPVVILSADATERTIRRLQDAGARAYLTKPLQIRNFLKLLDEILINEPEGEG